MKLTRACVKIDRFKAAARLFVFHADQIDIASLRMRLCMSLNLAA